jgi:hypothetical protein
MISSVYKTILTFAIGHRYFADNRCTCIASVPTNETMAILFRYGFTIRNKINGFELTCNSSQPLNEYFNYIAQTSGQNFFEFNLTTATPYFTIFTKLPENESVVLQYDSSSNANTKENGKVLLKAMNTKPNGNYVVGMVRFNFTDLINNMNENQVAVYEIQLENRATQWQYYVISNGGTDLANLSISSKEGISFTSPERITIQSGQEALLFSSGENLLPLTETQKYKFNLIQSNTEQTANGKANPKIVFKGLPNPDPRYFNQVKLNENNQLTSPMYVYI